MLYNCRFTPPIKNFGILHPETPHTQSFPGLVLYHFLVILKSHTISSVLLERITYNAGLHFTRSQSVQIIVDIFIAIFSIFIPN